MFSSDVNLLLLKQREASLSFSLLITVKRALINMTPDNTYIIKTHIYTVDSRSVSPLLSLSPPFSRCCSLPNFAALTLLMFEARHRISKSRRFFHAIKRFSECVIIRIVSPCLIEGHGLILSEKLQQYRVILFLCFIQRSRYFLCFRIILGQLLKTTFLFRLLIQKVTHNAPARSLLCGNHRKTKLFPP